MKTAVGTCWSNGGCRRRAAPPGCRVRVKPKDATLAVRWRRTSDVPVVVMSTLEEHGELAPLGAAVPMYTSRSPPSGGRPCGGDGGGENSLFGNLLVTVVGMVVVLAALGVVSVSTARALDLVDADLDAIGSLPSPQVDRGGPRLGPWICR